MSADYIDVVFDGPPANESGRFVETEDTSGASVSVGQWIDRGDGMWALRIPRPAAGVDLAQARIACASRGVDSSEFATAWTVLALAEEQRTANLIAYTQVIDDTDRQIFFQIKKRLGLTS